VCGLFHAFGIEGADPRPGARKRGKIERLGLSRMSSVLGLKVSRAPPKTLPATGAAARRD